MITTAKANDLLKQLFSGTSYSASSGSVKETTNYYYIGLHTTQNGKTPDADGNDFDEPSIPDGVTDEDGKVITVNEYQRVYLFDTESGFKMGTPTDGIIKNIQPIMFPEAEHYGWGEITHFGIFTSKTGGKPIFIGELTTPQTIASGYIAIFRKYKLQVGLDRDPAAV